MLNPNLVKQQGLNKDDVAELEQLHEAKNQLFEIMSVLDPDMDIDVLKTYVLLLESLEFNMQRVWKFDQDRSFHNWWYQAPHCECPKMDNADPLMGYGGRIINGNCPLHGNK